ncbi:MAG: radical SAM family heme chaperone HemW [Pseudomonadota bacterium]
MATLTEPKLSLYLHFPWCLKKCPYCDFNSHQVPAAAERDGARADYVAAVLADIALQADERDTRNIDSVFIGGGTPSLFSPSEIARVLAAADKAWGFSNDAEITMEANPGALERDSFAGYRSAGVNRVSLGAQSFDAGALQRLGRLHSPQDTHRAVAEADAAGFERINLDVMHGLPGQTVAAAVDDIRTALSLGVSHISHYQLTLEPNTVFFAKPPPLPAEDILHEIGQQCAAVLSNAGFERYEVSAWAQHGAQSRHNLNYWHFGDYLAVGAGAHGKLTRGGAVFRYAQPMHPQSYIEAISARTPLARQRINDAAMPFEFFLNRLRVTGTVTLEEFEHKTGVSASTIQSTLDIAAERGLIRFDQPAQFDITALGQRFLNDLQALFLPP